jgi:hypothetical protein
MKQLMFILILCVSIFAQPGVDRFPVTSEDWKYMAISHDWNDADQKARAMIQAIAVKLDEVADLGIVESIKSSTRFSGQFWCNDWYVLSDDVQQADNQTAFSIIISKLSNPVVQEKLQTSIESTKPERYKLKSR